MIYVELVYNAETAKKMKHLFNLLHLKYTSIHYLFDVTTQ